MIKSRVNGRVSYIDHFIARKIRLRRLELGITRAKAALSIGISTQQLCNYEFAKSKISVSNLYDIANYLKIPITYFFENLQSFDQEVNTNMLHNEVELFFLTKAFNIIQNPNLRVEIIKFITSIGKA